METGSSSDSTETRLNFDISNITVKNHVPNTMADWITGLHLNHNPSNAVTLDIKTLPKVNIQTTVLLFS